MEKHLLDKNLLDQEWKQICKYEAEPNKCDIARLSENRAKNRNPDLVPCKNPQKNHLCNLFITLINLFLKTIIRELNSRIVQVITSMPVL